MVGFCSTESTMHRKYPRERAVEVVYCTDHSSWDVRFSTVSAGSLIRRGKA